MNKAKYLRWSWRAFHRMSIKEFLNKLAREEIVEMNLNGDNPREIHKILFFLDV